MRNYLKLAAACLAAFPLASCSSWAPAPETDASRYELKGDVKSMKLLTYSVDSTAEGYVAGAYEPSLNNAYVEFNSDGNTVYMNRFDKTGNPSSVETSEYNAKGQIMQTEQVSASGELLEKTVYTYKGGRLHTMKVTDGTDSLKKYEEYEYFPKDSVKVYYQFTEGKPAGYRIMTYDDRGNNTANVMFTQTGKKLSEFIMTYDSLGRKTSVISDNMLFGKLESNMSYDDNGMCSAMTLSGDSGSMDLRFEFTLDSHGNWIERVSYQDGASRPIKIEKREIVY